jgi:hypothetical protein
VPLRYVVRNLNGTRPVARLGDTTSFTVAECTPVAPAVTTGWLPVAAPAGVEVVDLSSHNEEAWAVGHVGPRYGVYRVEGGQLVSKGDLDVRSLAVDGETNVWALDPAGDLWRKPAAATAWARVRQNLTGPVFNYLSIDAGGGEGVAAMNHTYGNDGSRDFFYVRTVPTGIDAQYLMDDAQYVPDDTYSAIKGAVLYVDSADDTYLRKCAYPGCGRREGSLLAQTASHIKQISAVSETLGLIVDGRGQLQELTGTTFRPLPAESQPPVPPLRIEADPGRKHWMIAPDNQVYRFAPPP